MRCSMRKPARKPISRSPTWSTCGCRTRFGHSRAVAALADAAGQADGTSRSGHSRTALGGLHPRHRRTGGAGLDLDAGGTADRSARPTRRDCIPIMASVRWRRWAAMASRSRRWCCATTSGSTAPGITATRGRPIFRPRRASLPRPKRSRPRGKYARTGPLRMMAAAATKLRGAVREGKLCADAVEAVLACAGQPARRGVAERAVGLTPREIEVLRLIASGFDGEGGGSKAGDRTQDRRQSYPEPLFQDRRRHPGRRGALCAGAGPGSARNIRRIGNPPHVQEGGCGHPLPA